MRRLVLVCAAACSSQHGTHGVDATTRDGSLIDARLIDAVPDARLDAPPTGAPEIFAASQNDPHYLTNDGSYVYWTDDTLGGQVMRLAVSGGTPQTIASSQDAPQGIAIDATGLYWEQLGWGNNGNGSIMTLVGTTPTVLVAAHYPRTMAMDATNIYWTSDDGLIAKVPKTGGIAQTLVTASATAVASDGTNVYFLVYASAGTSLQRVPVSGGTPQLLVSGTAQTGLLVAQGRVFWKDCDTSTCSIYAMWTTDLAPKVIATWTPSRSSQSQLAADDHFVYWTNWQEGTVYRVWITGDVPELIASGQGLPDGITVDDQYVYWGCYAGNSIVMRAHK